MAWGLTRADAVCKRGENQRADEEAGEKGEVK